MQLKRSHTMKRASEFAMVRSKGQSEAGRFLILSTAPLPQAGEHSRFGIITTKRIGHAVVRNLLRRRVREILREHGDPLQYGHYVVIIPRHTAATASYQELEKDFQKLLKRKHFTS
jgi:ribonuclease P protein component